MRKNNFLNLEKAKNLLIEKNCTLVLVNDNQIFESKERGVKPLIEKFKDDNSYEEFSVADKVVGKGAAFIYLLLKIKYIHAFIISKPALKILTENDVFITYDTLVDNIINRNKDGICPIEECVLNENNPKYAYNLIIEKLKNLK